jgi:endonuclease YncB( thermonuclease family)
VPVGGFLILLCIVVPYALGSRDKESSGAAELGQALKHADGAALGEIIVLLILAGVAAAAALIPRRFIFRLTLKRGGVFRGRVTYVVDGDGIRLDNGLEVRLGDFDAPEWNEPGGKVAKRALWNIAHGRYVECTACEGARCQNRCWTYGRIVATCRLNGRRLGDLMRERGIHEGGR